MNCLPITATVKQGPEWLVSLLYCPPVWLPYALAGVGLATILVCWWAIQYRGVTLDSQVQSEMAENVLVIICVAAVALAVRGPLGYATTVAVAVVVGWPMAQIATYAVRKTL